MSASRRRHSEQLPLQRPLVADEVEVPNAIRHGADHERIHKLHRSSQHQQPHHHHQQQPLVRTRSSAHLFLGQLTGTCSSLLRRLSVKVRYLSLSLIPGSSGSRSGSVSGTASRPSTPPSRNRPKSADRVVEDIGAGQRVRPRRHTTTVCTTMDESTPVANHCNVSSANNDSAGMLVDYRTQHRHSPSPGSDSEATPTPSPCTFPMPVAAVEDTVYTSCQQHLRADDYPTLKGSSRRRRRHHHHSSSGSSGNGGNNNNNNNNHHNRHHHNRKSQTEASTGRDRTSPMENDHSSTMRNSCATTDDDDHQLLNESTTATPLALDQCFALGLNLTSLAPPKSSKSTDTFLAADQENKNEEEEEDDDDDAVAVAGSSACDLQSEQVDSELSTNNNGNTAPNPYFDWFLSCNLEEERSSSLGERRPSAKVSHRSIANEEEEEEDQQTSLEDLPYPIILDDWISPPSPPSPPPIPEHQHLTGENCSSMDRDPLAALRHHSTWFEEYAYPAYSSKSNQGGGSSSSKSSNRLSVTGTSSVGGSSRMMAEKAYPYVSSPTTQSRHSNTKYHQSGQQATSCYHLDPYDLLYDETAYQVSELGVKSLPASSGGKLSINSTSSSNIIPVPLSSSSSGNNNNERGVHPGPESFPGVEPGTRLGGNHGYGQISSTTSSSTTTASNKLLPSSLSSSIVAAAGVGQHQQPSGTCSSNATTRTVRQTPSRKTSRAPSFIRTFSSSSCVTPDAWIIIL